MDHVVHMLLHMMINANYRDVSGKRYTVLLSLRIKDDMADEYRNVDSRTAVVGRVLSRTVRVNQQ